jgi:hypothetical protein
MNLVFMYLFLWGYLKSVTYTSEPIHVKRLLNVIQSEFDIITVDMVWHIQTAVTFHVNNSLEFGGQQFKHLLQ